MPHSKDAPKTPHPPEKAPSEKEWAKAGAKSPDDFPEGETDSGNQQPAKPQPGDRAG